MKKIILLSVALLFASLTFAAMPFGKGNFVAFELDSKLYTINKTEIAYVLNENKDDMQLYFKGSPTQNPLILDFDDKPLLKKHVYEALVGKKLDYIKGKKTRKKKK